ncbi:hypothetical protein [Streptomyces abikoensis]|uniref:Uncharacterized protein n=1 Tax=Streptomyces abikoensis TaxID=97398 RepID=A0ABW7T905_9ACTN
MTSPAHTPDHPLAAPRPQPPGQGPLTADEALAEITRLAGFLCEHLADRPWRTAARIRRLAESLTAPQPRTA